VFRDEKSHDLHMRLIDASIRSIESNELKILNKKPYDFRVDKEF
jgi:hypothetical protein